MKFYYNLYVSDELKGKEQEIIYKLKRNQVQRTNISLCLHRIRKIISNSFTILFCFYRNVGKKKIFSWLGLRHGYDGALHLIEKYCERSV